jgi:AcrR family transcriptional regulator
MASPAKTRQRISSQDARASILCAADELLRTRPYRELSVDAVMAEAGLSRTIFYRHFADLPALVTDLLRESARDLIQVTDLLRESIAGPEDLREGLRVTVDFFVKNGPLVRALSEGAGVDAELDHAYRGFIRHFSAAVDDGLRARHQAGLLAPIDIPATAEALNCLNERYLIRSLGYEPQEDSERVLETLWTIWSRSLFTPST